MILLWSGLMLGGRWHYFANKKHFLARSATQVHVKLAPTDLATQTLENKRESDHILETPKNLEILGALEFPPVKNPFRNDPFSAPEKVIHCSARGNTVAAKPPSTATPSKRQLEVPPCLKAPNLAS